MLRLPKLLLCNICTFLDSLDAQRSGHDHVADHVHDHDHDHVHVHEGVLAGRGARGDKPAMAEAVLLRMSVSGEPVEVAAPPHWTLLEVLRYKLDLIGSKQGCDKGDCGACTVQLDGRPVCAC